MLFRRILPTVTMFSALALSISAAAQEGPRSEPRTITTLSNNFSGGQFNDTAIPDAGDGIDISSATIEAGEPSNPCGVGSISHTVWFKVIHPGGTLDINTAYATGSSYDTVVQLFRDDTGLVSQLTEIGCDNNSGGGHGSNDARLIMPNLASAVYIGRIACVSQCGASDLALSITYTPDESTPDNDFHDTPKPLKIGKSVRTNNAEHTSEAASENSTFSSCSMYNTVWYSMTVPIPGHYSFSTFGSFLNRPQNSQSDTKIAVYRSSGGPAFGNFTQLGCNDDFGAVGYGALQSIFLEAGNEIYVRVGSFSPQNLLEGSYYTLKTTVVSFGDVLTNSFFDTGSLTPWKMKITGGDDSVTNAYALSGYSARMAGGPGKTNSLKQSWSPADYNITLAKDSTVTAYFYYSTNGTESSDVSAKLTIAYGSGAPTVAKLNLQSSTAAGSFVPFYLLTQIRQANVTKVTLKITNKSPSGFVFIDFATVRLFGDPARSAKAPAGVLPPPAAPLGLRGLN
jgi:hypothetical protein